MFVVVFVSLKCQSMAINIKSPGAKGGLGKDSGSPGTALGRISWEEDRWERDRRWGQKEGCWELGAELVPHPTGSSLTTESSDKFYSQVYSKAKKSGGLPPPPI